MNLKLVSFDLKLAFKMDLADENDENLLKILQKSLIKLASKLFICVNALLVRAAQNATVCIIVGHICQVRRDGGSQWNRLRVSCQTLKVGTNADLCSSEYSEIKSFFILIRFLKQHLFQPTEYQG